MGINRLIAKENLVEKVTEVLYELRDELLSKEYTAEEVDTAIAWCIPECIAEECKE
jgi:hypothetical protein